MKFTKWNTSMLTETFLQEKSCLTHTWAFMTMTPILGILFKWRKQRFLFVIFLQSGHIKIQTGLRSLEYDTFLVWITIGFLLDMRYLKQKLPCVGENPPHCSLSVREVKTNAYWEIIHKAEIQATDIWLYLTARLWYSEIYKQTVIMSM